MPPAARVLISAYTIGSDAAHAGVLSAAQSVSAAQTAFTTAGVIALAAVLGTLFVRRAPVPTEPAQATAASAVASRDDASPRTPAAR